MIKVISSLSKRKKMPDVAAAALRLYVNISSNQYTQLKGFLAAAAVEYQTHWDCLPTLKSVRNEEDASLPSNVSYKIKNVNGDVIYTHNAKVLYYLNILCSFFLKNNLLQIEGPHDILEDMQELGPLFPRPKMAGRYYKVTDVIAMELFNMKDKISSQLQKLDIAPNSTLTVKVKIRLAFLLTQ